MRREWHNYHEQPGVEWANLYDDGTLGYRDKNVLWINRVRAKNCVALVRIKEKRASQ